MRREEGSVRDTNLCPPLSRSGQPLIPGRVLLLRGEGGGETMPKVAVPTLRMVRLLPLLLPPLLLMPWPSEGRNPCQGPHCPQPRQPAAHCHGAECTATTTTTTAAAAAAHHHHHHHAPYHHGAVFLEGTAHGRESAGSWPHPADDLAAAGTCKGIECLLRWRESRARPTRRHGAERAGAEQPRRAEGQRTGGGSGGSGGSPAGPPRFLPGLHAELVSASSASSAADLGSTGSPGVTLMCDVRPGENEVASEDALVLHLRLVHGQEQLLALVQTQVEAAAKITHGLNEQQMRLLQQQQQVLDAQRHLAAQFANLEGLMRQESDLRTQHRHGTKRWEDNPGTPPQPQPAIDPPLSAGRPQHHRHHHHHHHPALAGTEDATGLLRIPPGMPGLPAISGPRAVTQHAGRGYEADGGERPSDCAPCAAGEFCDFQRMPPECRRCSSCQPGFSELQTCHRSTDRICQDKDECTENPTFCAGKCLNTPGGYRCVGIIVSHDDDDDESSLCADGYYLGYETGECQACSGCPDGLMLSPCTTDADTSCLPGPGKLAAAWVGSVELPPPPRDRAANLSELMPGGEGIALRVAPTRETESLLGFAQIQVVGGRSVAFGQHGLVWADLNVAAKHSCRGFLQVSLRLNRSGGHRDELVAARIEPTEDDKRFRRSASLSSTAELEPGHQFSVYLRSPGQPCERSGGEYAHPDLLPGSLSFLWLSHDTGAVSLHAHTNTAAHYNSNYRPSFKVSQVSDPYVITANHDCATFIFSEAGVVKFAYRQALYSVGHGCIRDGYSLGVHVSRNGSAGESEEVTRVYFPGVTYRDTAVSAAGAVEVRAGDQLSFDVATSQHCSVRLFGDASGVSVASLLWVPRSAAAVLSAALDKSGVGTGAVRNKALRFRTVAAPDGGQVLLETEGRHSGQRFRLAAAGVVSVSFHLRLIHSCETVRLSLRGLQSEPPLQLQGRGPVAPLLQQVGGRVMEGSQWSTISLRGSLSVEADATLFFTLDCSRGRINNIFHHQGSHLFMMWISA
ncbi:uncharacterized protein LOC116954808 [Petromyzon marinus]|uniref:uncharacterized protein LOC116954808 n=1 Tax=Petromyzon marinus TaxID=7757 RepID=UPI003F72FC3F